MHNYPALRYVERSGADAKSKHPDMAELRRGGAHGFPLARPSGFLDSAFGPPGMTGMLSP